MSIRAAASLTAAFAAATLSGAGNDMLGGWSKTDAETERHRKAAKAQRETWEIPDGESRQVRRARERREAKARRTAP